MAAADPAPATVTRAQLDQLCAVLDLDPDTTVRIDAMPHMVLIDALDPETHEETTERRLVVP